jgi:hypothetical protein
MARVYFGRECGGDLSIVSAYGRLRLPRPTLARATCKLLKKPTLKVPSA